VDDLLTHPPGKDPGTKPQIETAKQPPPKLNPVIFSPSQSKYHLLLINEPLRQLRRSLATAT
jgi:hypothetical protein